MQNLWKMTTQKTCSYSKCFQDREKGDTIFCSSCRLNWVRYCKRNKIHHKEIPERVALEHLNDFKEGVINDITD